MRTEIACTVFPDLLATHKEEHDRIDDLLSPDRAWSSKHACPLIKLALFGDDLTDQGSYRSDANVRAILGAEGDYDEGVLPMDAAATALEAAGVEAVLYTSASNTLDVPRWRLLLPFATQYEGTPGQMRAWRIAALRRAEEIIGARFARESDTLSQAFFIGQVMGSHYDVYHCKGARLDRAMDITGTPEVEERPESDWKVPADAPPASVEEATYYLSHIDPDCDYVQWVHVGMALKNEFASGGFELWCSWSKRSEGKFPGEREMALKWATFRGDGITYGTLVHMAREGGADTTKFAKPCHGLVIPQVNERLQDSPTVGGLMANPTEDSVALAFAERHRGEYIYMHGRGTWCRWDGKRWQPDKVRGVHHAIRDLARAYNAQGRASPARAAFVENVAKHLKTDPDFARELEAFDSDNYLLNCPDGTYDLRTMVRHEHSPADNITYMTAVAPTEKGGKLFRRFLKEVTLGDKGLEDFLQVALGACLSGAIEEHWFMFWSGKGRNGKNTLGDRVLYVMGDYARTIPSATLMSQRNRAHATEIMNVKGKRLVTSSEIEEGAHWAEAKLKELTGDDHLNGHYMKQDWVSFKRTHKHLVYGNHRPQLRNVDLGIRRRLKIVPFRACFDGREDADLPQKLEAEAGYILWWMMDGHRRWLAGGKKIGTCDAVEAETSDYYSAQSTVETWIAERCVVEAVAAQPGRYWVTPMEAYTNYRLWKEGRGENPTNMTRFSEQLSQRFEKMRANGARFRGLRLKHRADPD